MALQGATLALDGGDPRLSREGGKVAADVTANLTLEQLNNLFDPKVTFEEYLYYASITRAHEANLSEDKGIRIFPEFRRFKTPATDQSLELNLTIPSTSVDTTSKGLASTPSNTVTVSTAEWEMAHRAGRSATWGAVFYLITTDILGPYTVP